MREKCIQRGDVGTKMSARLSVQTAAEGAEATGGRQRVERVSTERRQRRHKGSLGRSGWAVSTGSMEMMDQWARGLGKRHQWVGHRDGVNKTQSHQVVFAYSGATLSSSISP